MPTIDDILHRFDGETSRREFSMRIGGYSPAEIREFVSAREDRRQEIVRELERETAAVCRH
jgi:hypothetical protein